MTEDSGQQPPNWGSAYPQGQPPGYGSVPGQGPQGQPPGYGSVPGQAPQGGLPPKHPQATLSLVLGIVSVGGMFLCVLPILISPFAWVVGARTVREIDANPTMYSGRSEAYAGKIMGIIGTVLLVVGVLLLIGLVAVLFTAGVSTTSTSTL